MAKQIWKASGNRHATSFSPIHENPVPRISAGLEWSTGNATQLTIVNPVTESNTSRNQGTLIHNQLSTVVSLGRLRLPSRDSTRVHAVSNTRHNSADDKMRQIVRSALQDGTSCHSDTTKEDGPPSAQRVADENGENSSQKASQIVRRDCDSLVCAPLRYRCLVTRDSRVVGVDSGEIFRKGWQV